ncbi:putative Aryl-alcohol dehydrogenase (NADP(+)) [Escherichia coli]|uniref:Putative Aryl-alcohol dehydrogenase (NADP(+)) n=1 Tax=Escherichia coli TaxID=562 RepID=A0A376S7M3_ECOLX|nr:putative Aryl-alcohol dehydrogenase (NADP(+)) [Escherichia coli]
MQYTRLGKSDLLVSRICMGCMGFGDPSTGQHSWTLDETASRDIIRYGLEKGINFYDTAIAYQNGSSERYVGRALREMAKRDDIVLATKFLPRTPAQIAGGISGKEAIAQSLDQSLKNLGMDYIDLYIYHIWDYNTPHYRRALKRYIPLLLLAKYDLLVFQTAMPGSWRRRTPLLNAKG